MHGQRHVGIVPVARSEGLFASDLPRTAGLNAGEIDTAVRATVDRFGGIRGCSAVVARYDTPAPGRALAAALCTIARVTAWRPAHAA